ncbi:MAG: hypothetical protein WBV25_11760 [Methylocella sp.]
MLGEAAIRRLAAVRADGLTMQQLAMCFNCSLVTIERKLAELRNLTDDSRPDVLLRF